jgi:hypothetical protein
VNEHGWKKSLQDCLQAALFTAKPCLMTSMQQYFITAVHEIMIVEFLKQNIAVR